MRDGCGWRASKHEADAVAAITAFGRAAEATSDIMVAFGRVLDRAVRESEELLTVDQRLRYYALRDDGVLPFDAFEQVIENA